MCVYLCVYPSSNRVERYIVIAHFGMLTVHSALCVLLPGFILALQYVSCVCRGDKAIYRSISRGPCYHLGGCCILVALRETIPYPAVNSSHNYTAHSIVVVLMQVR